MLPGILRNLVAAPVLFWYPAGGHATSLSWLVHTFGTHGASVLLVAVSSLALLGWRLDARATTRNQSALTILLFVPQALAMIWSAGAGISAARAGMYADGTVIPGEHIFLDQLPYLVAVVCYLVGALWPYLPWTSR